MIFGKKYWLGHALASFAFLTAQPVAAATVVINFSGTISDQIGDMWNAAPVGTAFSGVITYDDAAPRSRVRGFISPITGQFDNSFDKPFLTSGFTLGERISASDANGVRSLTAHVTEFMNNEHPDTLFFSASGFLLTLYDASNSLTYARLPTEAELSKLTLTARFENRYGNQSAGNAAITFGAMSPVPDSSTWMLMLTGFAATGAALRRRRANRIVTA